MGKDCKALAVLNVLMNTRDYVDTQTLVEKTGCNRKTVYNVIDILEVNGFSIDIRKKCGDHGEGPKNYYKFIKLCGLGDYGL